MEYIYRTPEFEKAVNEYFDLSDKETFSYLRSLEEADQNSVLTALTSKLYDKMVEKVDDIDYSLRNNIIDLALDFMFNDKGAYLPSQRDISLLLSLIHNCFLITDEDNLEIDIFESDFSSDDLYELAYLYDYKSDLPKRKLNAIEKDIDEDR